MTRLPMAWLALFVIVFSGPAAAEREGDAWAAYLDYAYVYSSAEPAALRARLDEYAREGGSALQDYLAERLDAREARGERLGEADIRRRAIAHLLTYVATGDAASLESAVEAVGALGDRLERHENRYWTHYVRAHQALHYGDAEGLVREVFELWFRVIVPLEATYATHQTLSLDQGARAGFVSALPYLYENVARLVLLRSQRAGLVHGLDPLAAVVRFLHDSRVGAYPEVVPLEASSREFLEQIVTRLEGAESDGGSLSFTLALFEASRRHAEAQALLASEGLSEKTQEAIRVSIGAYESALRQADTLQGQCAVYARVLRQLGEIYAAKQRLGVEPEIDVPFSIELATEIYAAFHADLDAGWEKHGYRDSGRGDYLAAMHRLWEEIQEASFNAAEYYLAKGIAAGAAGDASLRNAVGHYARYLAFFQRFSGPASQEALPDSAYFAAFWAARGIGDAVLHSAGANPSTAQVSHATERYRQALALFPFDARLWSSLALALERQGREDDYLELAKPIAEATARSRSLDAWIQQKKTEAGALGALRIALSDDLAIMYLGFADAENLPELERGLEDLFARQLDLERRRGALEIELSALETERGQALPTARSTQSDLPPVSAALASTAGNGFTRLATSIAELDAAKKRLATQIEARARALPLFRAALETEGLGRRLGTQRGHPAHALLRSMHFENR